MESHWEAQPEGILVPAPGMLLNLNLEDKPVIGAAGCVLTVGKQQVLVPTVRTLHPAKYSPDQQPVVRPELLQSSRPLQSAECKPAEHGPRHSQLSPDTQQHGSGVSSGTPQPQGQSTGVIELPALGETLDGERPGLHLPQHLRAGCSL